MNNHSGKYQQPMPENHILETEFLGRVECSQGKRFLISFIDGVFVIAIAVLTLFFLGDFLLAEIAWPGNQILTVFLIFIAYRFITINLFGATPGMKICRVEFLNAREKPLTVREQLCASMFVFINGVEYYNK
jgi:uncharacterized RDD family membrane protein YckC